MTHTLKIQWQRNADEAFTDNAYHRAHRWHFDGGATVKASSSPHIVKPPYSDETAVDPEEAFVAAVSSCHMLFFLSFAAGQDIVVDNYCDEPMGTMQRSVDGGHCIAEIILRPTVDYADVSQPTTDVVRALHDRAHRHCFIAQSVKSVIRIEA